MGQSIVDFDAADVCRLYVTTMKWVNIQDDTPSIPFDKFKNRYRLVFDLTSAQDATKILLLPRIGWRSTETRAKLDFFLKSNYWTPCIEGTNVFGCSRQVWCSWKKSKQQDASLQQRFNRIPLLKYRYCGSFTSDYVPTFDNVTFAKINKQPSNMQGAQILMVEKFHDEMLLADCLGRKKHRFFKQHSKEMMPAQLQSHPSVCGFNKIYAALHLFKFCQEAITGVQDFNVPKFQQFYSKSAVYMRHLFKFKISHLFF